MPWIDRCSLLPMVLALGCGSAVGTEDGTETETGSGSSSTSAPSPTTSSPTTSTPPGTTGATETSTGTNTGPDTASTGGTTADPSGTSTGEVSTCRGPGCAVDVLFVVDNSGTMADEQAHIGRAMAQFEAQLSARELDVQVMFTTVDFGNPLCTPFEPEGYDPVRGAPVSTSCTDRLDDFTGLGASLVIPEACTDVCPNPAAPVGDPFVAFDGTTSNAPRVTEEDIDDDGILDSAEAMTMACLAPQGINGCGYEQPLESMLQALNPAAEWNAAARPFLRDEAALAIVIITDEADCSVADDSVMENSTYMEVNPATGVPQPTSAICWNAGVTCTGPDAQGVYDDCDSANLGLLQDVTRYTDFLINEFRTNQDKEVVMLGVTGIPQVTEHADDAPFEPLSGGVADLVYRDWIDGQYPGGDILPAESSLGVTAADKQFEFGIGPGCTAVNDANPTGQAIPPVRIRHVCESLNVGDAREDLRCCLESVCDSDYRHALQCLVGLIDNVAG